MIKLLLVAIVLSIGAPTLSGESCEARASDNRCECMAWSPLRTMGSWRQGPGAEQYTHDQVNRSTHVFVGTAEPGARQRVRFRVKTWYKGGERDTITIRPAQEDRVRSSCDLPVKGGEEWLIFTEVDSLKVPYSVECRGSRLRSEADSLIKYLGTGWTPRTR